MPTTAAAASTALELARAAGDTGTAARALNAIAKLAIWIDSEAARPGLVESVELAERAGDAWCLADSLETLAWTYVNQDDHAAAAPLLARALAVAGQQGNRQLRSWCLLGQGVAAARRGDFVTACATLEAAAAAGTEVGDLITYGSALGCLASVHRLSGESARARQVLLNGLEAVSDSGTHASAWFLCLELGAVDLDEGDHEAARLRVGRALSIAERLGNSYGLATCLLGAADVDTALGDAQAAGAALERALDTAGHIGNRFIVAAAQHRLGRLARLSGDTARAESLQRQALDSLVAAGIRPQAVEVLEELALLTLRRGEDDAAARLLATAAAERRAMGLHHNIPAPAMYEAAH